MGSGKGIASWRTVGAAVTATSMVGLPLLGVLSPSASADEVPQAITKVDLVQTSADRSAQTQLSLNWAVPDSAKAGDTFVLGLPRELRAVDGSSFDLRTGPNGGPVVATAVVRDGVVTFTLTDYVDAHLDVSGSAWFRVAFTDVVRPGDTPDLVFTTTGAIFHDSVTVTGTVDGDYSTSANKWQSWSDPDGKGPLTASDGILWAVNAPRITADTAGGDITFVDEPGPGQAVDCDNINLFWGSSNGGAVNQEGSYGSDRYTKECSKERVSITMKTYTSDIGRIPYVLGRSTVTDKSLAVYRNSGTVRVARGGTYNVGDTIKADAGGVGAGRTPTAPSTSAPTSSGPTTAPATPATTPVSPGQPAPGTTTTTTKPTASSTAVPPVEGSSPTTSTTTTSTTAVAAGSPATPPRTTYVSGSSPANNVSRIDTGVPTKQHVNGWLVGGGLALAAASGAGLLLAGRRRDTTGSDQS